MTIKAALKPHKKIITYKSRVEPREKYGPPTETGKGMDETSLRKIHPAIFTGTYLHRHYPSVSLLFAYTYQHRQTPCLTTAEGSHRRITMLGGAIGSVGENRGWIVYME